MIVIPGLLQWLRAAGKRITSWVEESNGLRVEAHSTVRRAACLRRSPRSSRLHGHYRRAIADSLCFGRPVTSPSRSGASSASTTAVRSARSASASSLWQWFASAARCA